MTDLHGGIGRTSQPAGGRPVRKDEIEIADRGLYIESWLPERRSRRKPLPGRASLPRGFNRRTARACARKRARVQRRLLLRAQ